MRTFAATIAAALLFAAPAAAQGLFDPVPAPTIQEPDPGVDHQELVDSMPQEYRRHAVFYRSEYPPGTIIVNTADRFLYLIRSPTVAMRYGVGVGRDGFQWGGTQRVSRKAEWPDWTPPPKMMHGQLYLPRFMAGGPGNPMGPRAMYLGATIYRIHGTNAPETIGHALSSGCFRLANGDVIDLFDRVPVGTKVIIRHGPSV